MTVLTLFSVFLARQIIEIRRQTTFVDSVTHELRSPLASIRLGLDTLGREGLDVAQREQLREMMLDDVERLSGFIGDILEANRIEHGSHVRASNLVSLAELVDRCVKTVTKRHKLDPAQVKVDVDPELEFETDATALETVLKNLLDNAVKYSDSPAEVLVTAQCRDRRLLIAVEDNGVGIPRRLLKRVFDRFYRVDEETTRARRGTGLGLFVVRALVRGLGGRLRAHSEGLGTGTRVTVELPLETKVPEAAPGKAFG
jgi:signal transduction histidine kinase